MEDDNISLTSTKVTEYSSDDEFEVDRILAEKSEGDQKKYLLSWLGYEEEKHTWEPVHHIQNDEILHAWQDRKRLEERGLEKPYDVKRWTQLINDLARAKAERKRRRKEKRKRAGIKVSPDREYEPLSEDSESDEAMEADAYVEDDPGMKPQKKTAIPKVQVFGQHTAQGKIPYESASSSDESPLIVRKKPKAKVADKAKKDISSKATGYAGTARPEVARPLQIKVSYILNHIILDDTN